MRYNWLFPYQVIFPPAKKRFMDSDAQKSSEDIRREMESALNSGSGPGFARFALACLGGIPFAGGAFGGAAGAWAEKEQARLNKLFQAWLKLQEEELKEIGITLVEVMARLDAEDPVVQERIESPEYLSLVRKCFRDWSAAESEEKRKYVRNLLTNAAACRLTSDDVLRLFVQWINDYSEAHFAVIKDVYQNRHTTRRSTWQRIHGANVREDSAEADLFKLLYRDLSTGGILRIHRPTDMAGNFLKKPAKGKRIGQSKSHVMKSAFEGDSPYELTKLGEQFIHYTMNEIVPKIQYAASEKPKPK